MEECWEELANAIIIQAAKDFRSARKMLRRYPSHRLAKRISRETEEFFLSLWYAQLTDVDGRYLLNRLRREKVS